MKDLLLRGGLILVMFGLTGCATYSRLTLQYTPRGDTQFDSKGRTLNVNPFEDARPVDERKTASFPSDMPGVKKIQFEKYFDPHVVDYVRQGVVSEIMNANLFEVKGPGSRYTLNAKVMSFSCTRNVSALYYCMFTYIGIFVAYFAPVEYTATVTIDAELMDETTKQIVYQNTVTGEEKTQVTYIYDYRYLIVGDRFQGALSRAAVMLVNDLAEKVAH